MKVLILNTYRSNGGAAIASRRLAEALSASGVGVSVIRMKKGLPFYWERFVIWLRNGFSRRNLFAVSTADAGTDVTKTAAFREADIIHLHWINQGFISMDGLQRIFDSGKPVVWTLHDMWPVTGICHHAESCTKFGSGCSLCPLLLRPAADDLSNQVFAKKAAMYPAADLTFVGCSEWIAGRARNSSLTAGHRVLSIPNPIDTGIFSPGDREVARRALGLPAGKKLILFCSAKTTDPRKGIAILSDALGILGGKRGDLGLVVIGAGSETLHFGDGMSVFPLPFENDERRMVEIYRACDLFVTPSMLDNLPNTVMEAMACGTPCVGFDIGGIPEMIDDGVNGYIAKPGSAEDLASKMEAALDPEGYPVLCSNAREKALRCYSSEAVAARMIGIYRELLPVETGADAPMFSFVTVTYNAAATLPRTLESLKAQTYAGFEHIIVDGASSDGTVEIAREYADSRPGVRVISERDKGIYDAMNKGLAVVGGKYVCFLNAGDSLHAPSTLAILAEKLADIEPDVIYGSAELVDADGNDLGPRKPLAPGKLGWKSFRRGMVVSHQAFFARVSLARKIPYDLRYRFSSDQDWCIRVMRRARSIENSGLLMVDYLSEGTTSANRRASLIERFKVYRRHYGLFQTIVSHIFFILRLPFK